MRILQWQGKLLLLALLAMFAAPSIAQADHGRRGRDRSRVVVYADFGRYDHGYRGGYYDGYPRGWDRGRKVGWGDCDLPPGLARKYGCYDRSYYPAYYRHYPDRYPRRGRVRGSVTVHIPF